MGMKMAKASEKDIEAVMKMSAVIDTISDGFKPASDNDEEDDESSALFDPSDSTDLRLFYDRVMDLMGNNPGALMRVVGGFHTIMHNDVVDPEAKTLELHPRIVSALALAEDKPSFQSRIAPWMEECFGPMIAGDKEERNHRFLEEAVELVQACDVTAYECHQIVDYVFGRPVGKKPQEVGGVMVTLAALCLAHKLDMNVSAETELARISQPDVIIKIREKQKLKPAFGPLPGGVYPDRRKSVPFEGAKLQFPVALRKMWSATEVQAWLDQQGPLFSGPVPVPLALPVTDEQIEKAAIASGVEDARDSKNEFRYQRIARMVRSLTASSGGDGFIAIRRVTAEALVELWTDECLGNKGRPGSPSHGHEVPGIWDSGNGALGGKPCAECALYNEVIASVKASSSTPA